MWQSHVSNLAGHQSQCPSTAGGNICLIFKIDIRKYIACFEHLYCHQAGTRACPLWKPTRAVWLQNMQRIYYPYLASIKVEKIGVIHAIYSKPNG